VAAQRFADFVFRRRGRSAIWVDPSFASEAFIDLISDPDRLLELPDCEIIKDQSKIKVGCVLLGAADRQVRVYIKRYDAFSWRHRLVSIFFASGAIRSLRGAVILADTGVATARPIAAIEHRQGRFLSRSFYLTEEVAGSKIVNRIWLEDLAALGGAAGVHRRRDFLRGLSQLFARLHEKNIYHNDLKDFNILAVPQGPGGAFGFFVLDLEGVRRFSALNRRRRIKNLVQINRTLGKYLSRSQRMRFLRSYLGSISSDAQQRKLWARQIEQASRALDLQKVAI